MADDSHVELWAFNTVKISNYYWKHYFDKDYLELNYKTFTHDEYKNYHYDVLNKKVPYIHILNSFYQNERQRIQQGVFIIPTDISLSLINNIKSMETAIGQGAIKRIRIRCNKPFLTKAIPALKVMNITSRSLFPDLSGFAESLQMRMFQFESLIKTRDSFINA